MIDFGLSAEQEQLVEQVSRLSTGYAGSDEKQGFPRGVWNKYGSARIQGLCIPEEYGGGGRSALSTAVALEALGFSNGDAGLNFAMTAHLLACAVPLWLYGTEEQKKKYLPGMCNGSLIACNGMTEAGSGSDVFAMKTNAVKQNGNYFINGTKIFITNAPVADITILYALTDESKGFYGGVSCFIIENNQEGVSRSTPFKKTGLHSAQTGEITLNNVQVREENLIGKAGGGSVVFTQSMLWERALMAAMHAGSMRRLIQLTRQYILQNQDKSGADNQGALFLLADIAVLYETSKLSAFKASAAIDLRSANATLYSSMAKIVASENLNKAAQMALEITGLHAGKVSHQILQALCDAPAANIYSGTNEIQKNILAACLLA